MRRLICVGCGAGEDLNDPSGNIHTMKLVDLTPMYTAPGGPDESVSEDLCRSCRDRLRREFFGVVDEVLLDMPLMKGP